MVSIVRASTKKEYLAARIAVIRNYAKEYTMSNRKKHLTVSEVKEHYISFFERIMVLYNLTFSKKEKDHDVEDVKRYAIALYETGRIDNYDKKAIKEALEDFASLLAAESNKWDIDLEYLDATIDLTTSSINAEIGALIH